MTAQDSVLQGEPTQVAEPVTGFKKAFAGIPESDYVRDILALVLLGASLKLPLTMVGGQAAAASSQALYVLATVLVALALTLPYLARVGLLPKGWTVASTRALRIALAVPYIANFLWLLIGPHFVKGDTLGVGTAFAVGGAGVALAAQARASELGPESQDRKAGATALLAATVVAMSITVAYLASIVVTVIKANEAHQFPMIAAIFAIVSAAAFVVIPALGVVLKKTAGWRAYTMGLGIFFIVVFYLGASSQAAFPVVESFTSITTPPAAMSLLLPLTFLTGVGSFLLPALAAIVSAPAFKRVTTRTSAVEKHLDLASITARMVVLVGAILVLLSVIHLVEFKKAAVYVQPGMGRATSQVITVMILGLILVAVALLALKGFKANPANSRIGIGITLGVTFLVGVILMNSVHLLGQQVTVLGHLILVLGLPAIGIYALVGNKETHEFFAANAKTRPEPNPRAFQWAPSSLTARPQPGHQPGVGHPNDYQGAQQNGSQPTGATPLVGGYQPVTGATGPFGGFAQPGDQAGAQTGAQPFVTGAQSYAGEASYTSEQPAISETQNFATQSHEPVQPYEPAAPQVDEVVTETVSRSAIADLVGQAHAAPTGHGFTREIAVDPNTPAHVLAKIAEEAPELRAALAENPTTYDALLGWLAQIGDPEIDAALARRSR